MRGTMVTSTPAEAVAADAPSGLYTLDKNHASVVIRATHFGMSQYTLRMTGLDAVRCGSAGVGLGRSISRRRRAHT